MALTCWAARSLPCWSGNLIFCARRFSKVELGQYWVERRARCSSSQRTVAMKVKSKEPRKVAAVSGPRLPTFALKSLIAYCVS